MSQVPKEEIFEQVNDMSVATEETEEENQDGQMKTQSMEIEEQKPKEAQDFPEKPRKGFTNR